MKNNIPVFGELIDFPFTRLWDSMAVGRELKGVANCTFRSHLHLVIEDSPLRSWSSLLYSYSVVSHGLPDPTLPSGRL